MRLVLDTTTCSDMTFEEVVDFASEYKFTSLEVSCCPRWKSHRKITGACHIDVENINYAMSMEIKKYCKDKNIEISALSYQPSVVEVNEENCDDYIQHLYKMIDAAHLLGVSKITTIITCNQTKKYYYTMEIDKKTWNPIYLYANDKKVELLLKTNEY